jgi:hypothetical protein
MLVRLLVYSSREYTVVPLAFSAHILSESTAAQAFTFSMFQRRVGGLRLGLGPIQLANFVALLRLSGVLGRAKSVPVADPCGFSPLGVQPERHRAYE